MKHFITFFIHHRRTRREAGSFAANSEEVHFSWAASDGASNERKVLFYQSAMHPWVKSDKPGRCTICGMALTPVYEGDKGH
jgi:hypothetical protein